LRPVTACTAFPFTPLLVALALPFLPRLVELKWCHIGRRYGFNPDRYAFVKLQINQLTGLAVAQVPPAWVNLRKQAFGERLGLC